MSVVLVAEDSPSIRLLLLRRLEMAGHEVIEARDGDEAVAAVQAGIGSRSPDIVLLDVMMPHAQGSDVLHRIKRVQPELPVLVVSGMPGLRTSDVWEAADGRLSKPIDFELLLSRIESLTSGPPRP